MPPPFGFRPNKNLKPKKRRLAGELNKIEQKRKYKEDKKQKEAEEARADQPFFQLLACLKESNKPDESAKPNDDEVSSQSDGEEEGHVDDNQLISEDDEDIDNEDSEEEVQQNVERTVVEELLTSDEELIESDPDDNISEDGDDDTKFTDTKEAFNAHINCEITDEVIEQFSQPLQVIPGYSKSMGDFDFKSRCQLKTKVDTDFPSSMSKVKIRSLLKSNALVGASTDSSKQFRIDCLSLLLQYVDLLYLKRNSNNANDLRRCYCLHILNHLLNVRDIILKNNGKIDKLKAEKKPVEDLLFRDQGFTRARVLILLPFRHSVKEVVSCLASSLFGPKAKISSVCRQWARFTEEFSQEEEVSSSKKPQDFIDTFTGNIDDSFRIGLAVTKKSLKLYTDFKSSDIIICSPLSLRMMIKGADANYDYLSSIEIFVIDQTEVLLMQNWEHVIEIAKVVNQLPKDSSEIDFSRVRLPLLDGNASFYRQNIFIGSSYVNEVISLFSKYSKNIAGQVSFVNQVSPTDASISKVLVKCIHNFVQHKCNSLANCPESRFEHFKETVVPQLHHQEHTMIFISCYFDFVRIRNYLIEKEINCVSLCEYTKQGKIAQARSLFFHGSRKILLYTERFHFYHRYTIKGVQRIYFYQLPSQGQFYSQVCNFLTPQLQGKRFAGGEDTFTSDIIMCPMDGHRVTSILGNELASKVLKKKHFTIKT